MNIGLDPNTPPPMPRECPDHRSGHHSAPEEEARATTQDRAKSEEAKRAKERGEDVAGKVIPLARRR